MLLKDLSRAAWLQVSGNFSLDLDFDLVSRKLPLVMLGGSLEGVLHPPTGASTPA
jgi:hypothetical protein